MEHTNSPELTSYRANCHCGAVTYTVRIPSLKDHDVSCCNCSICMRNGYLMVYPKPEDITFLTGYDDLTSYSFADSNKAEHKFCPTCGSSVVAIVKGHPEFLAVNVRLFQNINLDELQYKYVDGRGRGLEYKVPESPSNLSEMLPETSDLTRYSGNCHCGSVTFAFLIPSLDHLKVINCDCSICTRNGYLFVYPDRNEVTFHTGYNEMRPYLFGEKKMTHKFCPTCGSSVMIDFHGGPCVVVGGDRLAINVRMWQDIQPDKLNLDEDVKMRNEGFEYSVGK